MSTARHWIEYGSRVDHMPLGCRLKTAWVAALHRRRVIYDIITPVVITSIRGVLVGEGGSELSLGGRG